jgi:hypothetical protein
MTGWGSIGLWRFQEVTEPRHINYNVHDDDQCIQERNGFSTGYNCAAHGHTYCNEVNGYKKDFDQCCPCTCNPDLPECLSSYVGCYRDDGNRDFDFGPKVYGFTEISCREACANYPYFALQNNGWCSCDYAYSDPASTYPAIDDELCNVGNTPEGEGMGGPWANAVYNNLGYEEDSSYEYIGCYKDDGNRDLEDGPQ